MCQPLLFQDAGQSGVGVWERHSASTGWNSNAMQHSQGPNGADTQTSSSHHHISVYVWKKTQLPKCVGMFLAIHSAQMHSEAIPGHLDGMFFQTATHITEARPRGGDPRAPEPATGVERLERGAALASRGTERTWTRPARALALRWRTEWRTRNGRFRSEDMRFFMTSSGFACLATWVDGQQRRKEVAEGKQLQQQSPVFFGSSTPLDWCSPWWSQPQ